MGGIYRPSDDPRAANRLDIVHINEVKGDGALGQVRDHWRGIATPVGIIWLVAPFSRALLGWIFIAHGFRPLLPPDQVDSYIAGLILLAAASCTAMVFVWTGLVDGEPHFTLSKVALNDMIMVVAFAPIVAFRWDCPRSSCPGTRWYCRSCFTSPCR